MFVVNGRKVCASEIKLTEKHYFVTNTTKRAIEQHVGLTKTRRLPHLRGTHQRTDILIISDAMDWHEVRMRESLPGLWQGLRPAGIVRNNC